MSFESSITNTELLDYLCEWKAQYSEIVYDEVYSSRSKDSYWRMLRKLEDIGLIKNLRVGKPPRKILYLSKEASKELYPEFNLEIDEVRIYHEAKVSLYSRFLMNLLKCQSYLFSHQNRLNKFEPVSTDPDCVLKTFSKKNIALEVELTQKSRPRIYKKFDSYMNSEFDYFIYFFNNKSLAKNYAKRISEFINLSHESYSKKDVEERFTNKLIIINHCDENSVEINKSNLIINVKNSQLDPEGLTKLINK
jgi:hypothetical protein